jgi:hypothetical protein
MQRSKSTLVKGVTLTAGVALATTALILAGCAAMSSAVDSGATAASKATVPFSITDAPGDEVIAASLTLNSIVLTDSSGKTASILSSPVSFEAAHLDAVQEPLFTAAVPEDTYTSIAFTYSNAQVAYIDPTTKQLVQATATLASTGQTIAFSTPIVINNTTTSLLIDYLVAKSVAISGTTVTVTPDFAVTAAPIPSQPTNGTNGLQCGIQGMVTALGSNSFTLTNASGTALAINVNSSTQYQGLSGFSALAVGALVEVDTITQSDGTLLASRVAEQGPPPPSGGTPLQMLVGPVLAVTGSPATTFTQVVQQQIGGSSAASSLETDTIAINSTTAFQLPQRLGNVTGGVTPFTPVFSASTLFAGQVVSVATSGVTSNSATAASVSLSPQTIDGTVSAITSATGTAGYSTYTVTLDSGSWLATLTGKTTVTVYANGNVQSINASQIAVGSAARFNGFLFNNNGSLALLADVQADGPGHPIGPPPQQ